MTRSLLSLAFATAVGLAVTTPATAQGFALRPGASSDLSDPTKVVHTAVVRLADLDADSADGAQALLDRIGAAADAVCGAGEAVTAQRQAEFRDCRRIAVAGAVARMRSPALTRLAQGRAELTAR